MSSTSNYGTSDVVVPGRDVKFSNIIVSENINTPSINGVPYSPTALPTPLLSNKILRTNALATDYYWGDIPHGTANQLLQTNSTATGPEWTSSIDVSGDITSGGTITAPIGVIDDLTSTSSFTDLASVNTAISCSGGLTIDGSTSLQTVLINNTLTNTGAANLSNVNLSDRIFRLAGASGTNGQTIQCTGTGTVNFVDSNNLVLVRRTAALTNVNSTKNLFLSILAGDTVTSLYGTPNITVDFLSGIVTINTTKICRFSGTFLGSTFNVQGKVVFREVVSGTAIFSKQLTYLPGITQEQEFSFEFSYKPTVSGLTYELVMIPYGVGGTFDISAPDATYGTTNCVMYIQNQ